MELVKYEKTDYPLLLEWFAQYEWTPCEEECLPVNTYFVVKDGKKVALSCFLATDSIVAFLGITIADKNARGRGEAVDFLLKNITRLAAEQGYKYMNYFTDSLPMVERMEKQGFKVTDRGTAYILIGDLGGGNVDFFDD